MRLLRTFTEPMTPTPLRLDATDNEIARFSDHFKQCLISRGYINKDNSIAPEYIGYINNLLEEAISTDRFKIIELYQNKLSNWGHWSETINKLSGGKSSSELLGRIQGLSENLTLEEHGTEVSNIIHRVFPEDILIEETDEDGNSIEVNWNMQKIVPLISIWSLNNKRRHDRGVIQLTNILQAHISNNTLESFTNETFINKCKEEEAINEEIALEESKTIEDENKEDNSSTEEFKLTKKGIISKDSRLYCNQCNGSLACARANKDNIEAHPLNVIIPICTKESNTLHSSSEASVNTVEPATQKKI